MLNLRERATTLAALRFWQRRLQREGTTFADGFPHFSVETPCRSRRSTPCAIC